MNLHETKFKLEHQTILLTAHNFKQHTETHAHTCSNAQNAPMHICTHKTSGVRCFFLRVYACVEIKFRQTLWGGMQVLNALKSIAL